MDRPLAPELNEALLGRWEPVYRSRLHYLVTWGTRGHRPVLKANHVRKLQEIIPRLCEERHVALLEVAAGADHVHLLFALRPSQSVASAVRDLKGRTAMTLLAEHPELRVWFGGNLIWDDRYDVETVSPARIERIRSRMRSVHGSDDLAEAS